MEVAWGYFDYNLSHDSRNYDSRDIHSHNSSDNGRENDSYNLDVTAISIFIICFLGVAGNGMVIWLLGFRVQRNPFMTYILNLAVADLGLLIPIMIFYNNVTVLPDFAYSAEVTDFFFTLMYSTGQFLVTAISLDRCVAVFFPLWHRCHRPPRLSAVVCALMWVLSLLLATITVTVYEFFQVLVNAVLCLPLVTISTLALFVKVCFKPQQHRRGKLLTILLLALAFFLLFAFPLNAIYLFTVYDKVPEYIPEVALLLACLNSSVNPVIYFLIGRQRKTRHKEGLKMILQRAFKEEEEEGCTEESPAETHS